MARGDWHKSYLILCQNLFISSFKFKLFFTGRRNTVLGITKFFKEMKRDLWIGRFLILPSGYYIFPCKQIARILC